MCQNKRKLSRVPKTSQQLSGRRQTTGRCESRGAHGSTSKPLGEHLVIGQCFGANVSWCCCTNKRGTEAARCRAPAASALHNSLGRCRLVSDSPFREQFKAPKGSGLAVKQITDSAVCSLPPHLCPLCKAWKVSEPGTARAPCQPFSCSSSLSKTRFSDFSVPSSLLPASSAHRVFQGCSSSEYC